jgi:hypothetical protein
MSQVFCNLDDAHVDGLLSISTADTLAVSNVISASNRYPEWDGDIGYCQRQSYSKTVECDLCGKRRKGDSIVDDNGRAVKLR